MNISPESIHTHPSYFESLIVKGGYNHEIYESNNDKYSQYDLYQILKSGSSKSFVFIGQSSLRFVEDEHVKQGSIKAFNTKMIHRVLHTIPETLSLNVVFEDSENDEDFSSCYNLYLTKYGALGNIKTTRDVILNEKSQQFIQEIATALGRVC